MPVDLDLAWWNKIKKAHAKGFPTTGLTPALTAYEKALTTLDKKKDQKSLTLALAKLKEVKQILQETREKCDELDGENDTPKWDKLKDALDVPKMLKAEKDKLTTIQREIALKWRQEKAANVEEAKYEELLDEYEDLQKEMAGGRSIALFDEMFKLLEELISQARICHEINQSDNVYSKKYKQLESAMTSERGKLEGKLSDYQGEIDACAKRRKDLLKAMVTAETALKKQSGIIEAALGNMVIAAEADNAIDLATHFHTVSEAAAAAESAHQPTYDEFAPGTEMRNSFDVKSAKIDSQDSLREIAPHFSALIAQNKKNNAHIKRIRDDLATAKELMPTRRRR